MRAFFFVSVCAVFFVLVTGSVSAEECSKEDKLIQIIEKQNEKIDALLKRVEELEKKQESDAARVATEIQKNEARDEKIETLVSSVDKIDSLNLKPAEWAKNISFSGDFRYRFQFTDQEDRENRNEHRLRVRIALKSKISDELDGVIRIATGSSADARSTNQTLDGAFGKKNIWLDLAYLDWHPQQITGLNVIAGKMPNPFFRPGGSDMMWDADVNPEGIAAKYVKKCEQMSLFANVGGFWLDERSSDADAGLWAAQGGMAYNVSSDVKLIGGLTVYDFTNLKDQPVLGGGTNAYGNSNYAIGTTLYYPEDFTVVEAFAELDFKVANIPAAIYADYMKNTQYDEDNEGMLAGIKLGKCKDPGSWEFDYNYRRVERDAVIGALSDGDFLGGSTDGKGHKFSVGYQLTKPVKLQASYFHADKFLDNERDFRRAQFDINYKF